MPQLSMPRHFARRILGIAAALTTLGVLGVGVLLAGLWLERRTEVTLPAPTGPFAVGRSIHHWTDPAPDSLAPIAGTKRELLAWIWYPTLDGPPAAPDDYLPVWWRAGVERASGAPTVLEQLIGLLTRDPTKVHGHSHRDAKVARGERSFPVAIIRGGASSEIVNYSTLAEDLASHGYVVVGFDAPYRTGVVAFPDGRVIRRTPENNPELCVEPVQSPLAGCMTKLLTAWTLDIALVLDRLERLNASDSSGTFTGRLDLTRVGVFGHSFGGATAAQFCHDDPRCTAGIDVDGQPLGSVVQAGIRRPFMFLLSDHSGSSDPVTRQIEANIQAIYDRLPANSRLRVAIRGGFHFTFSDDGALLKSGVVRWLLGRFGKLGIDGRRQLALTRYCIRRFFDAYLKGTPGARPDLVSPLYPEIQILD